VVGKIQGRGVLPKKVVVGKVQGRELFSEEGPM